MTPAGRFAPGTFTPAPGRGRLEAALRELNQTWSGGPLSEPARKLLAPHASDVAELLALSDRLAIHVARSSTDWVVTHGEPHGGNVMRRALRFQPVMSL